MCIKFFKNMYLSFWTVVFCLCNKFVDLKFGISNINKKIYTYGKSKENIQHDLARFFT